jgi:hypothetical protein
MAYVQLIVPIRTIVFTNTMEAQRGFLLNRSVRKRKRRNSTKVSLLRDRQHPGRIVRPNANEAPMSHLVIPGIMLPPSLCDLAPIAQRALRYASTQIDLISAVPHLPSG